MSSLTHIPAGARVDSTLSKGLLIIEALSGQDGPLGVTELARRIGISKSGAFRLLQTLCTMGYVRRRPDKLYEVTLKTWRVGRQAVEALNLRALASEAMQMLSRETGEAVYLAVPEGLNVTYVDKIESRQPIRSWNPVGGGAPIHTVSTGKAILSADYASFRPLLVGNLTACTDLTITTTGALDSEMDATIRRGFAKDIGEFRARVHGYAAAIRPSVGGVIGAIGISLPDVNLPEDPDAIFGPMVRQAARMVAARITSP